MLLIQVVLLARLPFLERLAGFDRLTVWHRWTAMRASISCSRTSSSRSGATP
jgi:hypothetical protein